MPVVVSLLFFSFHERLAAFKREGNISSASPFDVPLSPLPELYSTKTLEEPQIQSLSAETEVAASQSNEPTPFVAKGEQNHEKPQKESLAKRYEAVLRRVKEREAQLAAEGSPEEREENALLKSLPQLSLILRSCVYLALLSKRALTLVMDQGFLLSINSNLLLLMMLLINCARHIVIHLVCP